MTTFDLKNIWIENGRIKEGRIRKISKALMNKFIFNKKQLCFRSQDGSVPDDEKGVS